MIKRVVLLASVLSGASAAYGGSYTATILYPLAAPAGASAYSDQVTADGSVGYSLLNGSNTHALLWSPPNGASTDLNPTGLGATYSRAAGEFGNEQVGQFGGDATGSYAHAVVWSGTAASAVDLNPSQLGAFSSLGHATDGTYQVGRGAFGSPNNHMFHALAWTGTAASAVDLNPTALDAIANSVALGVQGLQEVGNYSSATIPDHAVMWTGTAASAIDLHPLDPSLKYSSAVGTSGNEQVGSAQANGGNPEAFLWHGTAASAVNLNPTTLAGINASGAIATNGAQQVGNGFDWSASVDDDHALIWSGSADSVFDLHSVLPAGGTWNFSDACSIDAQGNVFGTANGTFDGMTETFAVEWSAVPEPGSPVLLTLSAFFLSARVFRRKKIPSAS